MDRWWNLGETYARLISLDRFAESLSPRLHRTSIKGDNSRCSVFVRRSPVLPRRCGRKIARTHQRESSDLSSLLLRFTYLTPLSSLPALASPCLKQYLPAMSAELPALDFTAKPTPSPIPPSSPVSTGINPRRRLAAINLTAYERHDKATSKHSLAVIKKKNSKKK